MADKLILLPENIAALHRLTAEYGGGKYQTDLVKVDGSDGVYTASATNGKYAGIITGPLLRDRQPEKFPDVRSVVPTDDPVAVCYVNPKFLAKLASVAAQCCDGEHPPWVRLEWRKDKIPLVMRTKKNSEGQEFVGLLMSIDYEMAKLDWDRPAPTAGRG